MTRKKNSDLEKLNQLSNEYQKCKIKKEKVKKSIVKFFNELEPNKNLVLELSNKPIPNIEFLDALQREYIRLNYLEIWKIWNEACMNKLPF